MPKHCVQNRAMNETHAGSGRWSACNDQRFGSAASAKPRAFGPKTGARGIFVAETPSLEGGYQKGTAVGKN